jgi:hypothetical protein
LKLEGRFVHKLRYRKLLLGLVCLLMIACLLMIGCQTVRPPGQSPSNQPAAPGQGGKAGSKAGSQAQSQAQATGPSLAQSIAQSPALTAVTNVTKKSAARLGSTISTRITHPIGRFFDSLGTTRARLIREDLQPTELGAVVLAGVIIVGGAVWVFTARRAAATRGRRA